MSHKYVLDTHTLIWHLEANPRLGPTTLAVLRDPRTELILPATALAEACWIVDSGRTGLPSALQLLADVQSEARLTVYPLTTEIIARTLTLTSVREMHDRQIVATALHLQAQGHRVTLLTRDENITASGAVSVSW